LTNEEKKNERGLEKWQIKEAFRLIYEKTNFAGY